ncbi:MAG: hypothetical protein GDA54_01675 [Alphaproteobacteria bacterium GM7ARS4]|nr:hypothetical protein [Alphaproteobacteria bacterium GM7ARS4]
MTRSVHFKNSFNSGEWDESLYGRTDLAQFNNAASCLSNVLIHPEGGIARRPGLLFLHDVASDGRLARFAFSREQVYLVFFGVNVIRVYRNNLLQATLTSPWSDDHLPHLCWVQSGDTMIITHEDVAPRMLVRAVNKEGQATWTLMESPVTRTGDNPYHGQAQHRMVSHLGHYWHMPYSALWPQDVVWALDYKTLPSVSFTTRTFFLGETLKAYRDALQGTMMRYEGTEGVFYFYLSKVAFKEQAGHRVVAVSASLIIEGGGTYTGTFIDKEKPLEGELGVLDFSSLRGWPRCCLFYQGRFAFAGSAGRPNRLWMSQSHDIWNFHLGESLDDEAIILDIVDDEINGIREVGVGRELQLFTSSAEWGVVGDVLTPSTAVIRKETSHGIYGARRIAPLYVDGAMLFIGRDGTHLREMYYQVDTDSYLAGDLSLLSSAMLEAPLEQVYDKQRHVVYIPCEAGHMAVLTVERSQQVAGWSCLRTQGRFRSVAVVGDIVYCLVERLTADGTKRFCLECFKEDLFVDSGVELGLEETVASRAIWSHKTLMAFQGLEAYVSADHVMYGMIGEDGDGEHHGVVLAGDTLRLPQAARHVVIGLPYAHEIAPLPMESASGSFRPIDVTFQLLRSGAMALDSGGGVRAMPLRVASEGRVATDTPLYSGTLTVQSSGWRRHQGILWRILQTSPVPFHLLSVKTHIKVIE